MNVIQVTVFVAPLENSPVSENTPIGYPPRILFLTYHIWLVVLSLQLIKKHKHNFGNIDQIKKRRTIYKMGQVLIKDGKENMDVKAIHQFLSEESYWAKGISFNFVNNSLDNSYCVGAFINGKQVGFGRLITDYYTFGWLADVYVLPEYRGAGISKKILAFMTDQPWFEKLRRIMLNTSDGHGLYKKFGFNQLAFPDYVMEVHQPKAHLEFRD